MTSQYSQHTQQQICLVCGGDELEDNEGDGFYYCQNCGARADDIIDSGIADADFVDKTGGLTRGNEALYKVAFKRKNYDYHHHPSNSSSAFPAVPLSAVKLDYDDLGPSQPSDFGSSQWKGKPEFHEDYYKVIRWRYLVGLQVMVQLQCEALVEKFNVNPIICGIAAEIWLRFVASTRILRDDWGNDAVMFSESQDSKKSEGRKTHYGGEFRNIYSERLVIVWCKSLKREIPLSRSLAVSYLACHVAREPVLSTDILRWTLEGNLPYFGAYADIEKSIKKLDASIRNIAITVVNLGNRETNVVSIGERSNACPLSASYMFRPSQAFPLQQLESVAASIAKSVGLSLPPVNFRAIASRYLKQLSLPVEKIIPYACCIYEWSLPPDLWLSASPLRLPARVCVMSILIVAIRILYNINGFGKWEMTLSAPSTSSSMDDKVASSDLKSDSLGTDGSEDGSSPQDREEEHKDSSSSVHKFKSDCKELLRNLEKRYDQKDGKHEYSKDLSTYLRYCKDVLFASSESGHRTYEDDLIEQLWEFYQKNMKDMESSVEFDSGLNQKRSRNDDKSFMTPPPKLKAQRDEKIISLSADTISLSLDTAPEWNPSDDNLPRFSQPNDIERHSGQGEASSQCFRDIAIRHLKIDMEEHRFCYIPPRENVKRADYLHYGRKRDDGSLAYVAHADYYILLRACAKVAQVDVRIMHASVLSLERRLRWIEKRIDYCIQEIGTDNADECHSDAMDES